MKAMDGSTSRVGRRAILACMREMASTRTELASLRRASAVGVPWRSLCATVMVRSRMSWLSRRSATRLKASSRLRP